MAKEWPFGKKNAPAKLKPTEKKAEVVEYERESEEKQKDLIQDKSQLKDKSFLDAMRINLDIIWKMIERTLLPS